MREQGQEFDQLSISEFCDIMWARVLVPPPMSDSVKFREAVYDAFYGEESDTPEAGPRGAPDPKRPIPANAQAALDRMREIRQRNMERAKQAENT